MKTNLLLLAAAFTCQQQPGLGFVPTRTASRLSTRGTVRMHVGHSHEHTHEHPTPDLGDLWLQLKNPKKLQTPQAKVFMIASAFFLISSIVRRRICRWDVLVFGGLTASMSVFNVLKASAKEWASRMMLVKDGIVRHSTPITGNYFFNNQNLADRVTLLGVAINIVLSISKLAGGIAFNSAVLVADAGHSLSDLLSDFITLWAVQIARLPADNDHPYGHGKFESVGSLFLSLTLIVTGLSVGSWSYNKMLDVLMNTGAVGVGGLGGMGGMGGVGTSLKAGVAQIVAHGAHVATSVQAVSQIQVPSWPALALAAFSIASKEWLYRITKRVGDSLNSQILIANAWHHRSDAFSSVLSLFSIAAAIFLPGCLVADSAAGIFIAGMITLTGLDVLFESVKQLTDASDEQLVSQIQGAVRSVEGVEGLRDIRARSVGSGSIVDITILTEVKLSASAASAIAERVRWEVMEQFPQRVLDVQVRAQSGGTACPLLSRNQMPIEVVEANIRSVLGRFEHSNTYSGDGGVDSTALQSIKRVTVHYINSAALCVDVLVSLDGPMEQAKRVAREMQGVLLAQPDVVQVEIQLDLLDVGDGGDGGDVDRAASAVEMMRKIEIVPSPSPESPFPLKSE